MDFLKERLTAREANRLAKELQREPDNHDTHARLLWYYMGAKSKTSGVDRERIASLQRTHALWLIENEPEASATRYLANTSFDGKRGQGGAQAARVWRRNVARRGVSTKTLINAGMFFVLRDKEFAEKIFERARARDDAGREPAEELAHMYMLEATGAPAAEKRRLSRKALRLYREIEPSRRKREERALWLQYAAAAALRAGHADQATTWAKELLSLGAKIDGSWNSGNAIHHGHTFLGKIALERGDIPSAENHLLDAAQVSGSPQLNSFGPKMGLAAALLELDRRDTVIRYLRLCRKFWKRHNRTISEWIEDIQAGRMPDFGANLDY